MDDMIAKFLFRYHAEDLRECFETLKRNNMRVNLKKYMFGISNG